MSNEEIISSILFKFVCLHDFYLVWLLDYFNIWRDEGSGFYISGFLIYKRQKNLICF